MARPREEIQQTLSAESRNAPPSGIEPESAGRKVLIELKAVDQLAKVHEAQLLNYLRATGMKLGLL